MSSPLRPDEIERRIRRVLSALPDRPAPAALEARVLERIAQARQQPWWQRSFRRWPGLARAVFTAGSAAIAAASVPAWPNAFGGLTQTPGVREVLGLTPGVPALLRVVHDVGTALTGWVPATWLYIGAAVAALLYAGLFGLGAAVYQFVRAKTPSGGWAS